MPELLPDPTLPLTESSAEQAQPRSRIRQLLLLSCGLAAAAGMIGAVSYVSARVELSPASGSANSAAKSSETLPSLLTAHLDVQTPEGMLILAYQQLAQGLESKAFATVEQLVKQQPDFALAQLLHGDLLLARTPGGALRPEPGGSSPEAQERRADLREESRLRLAALVERPPAAALPRQLMGLSAAVRHAIVVDTASARLYLFENGPHGLALLRDHYVAIGKQGFGKQVEGDMRTPLGTYHLGLRRDEAVERYGAAALPLNYPNEYDRLVGRSGSSIWLHGERAGSYARSPLSTDGCIVLSNDDMSRLADTVEARDTPVLIVNHVDWVLPSKTGDERMNLVQSVAPTFETAYQQWSQARLSQNATALRAFYETGLQRGSDSETERLERKLLLMSRQELPVQSLERLSVLPGQDQQAVVIVTYRELSPPEAKPKLKRQYWREQDGRWRIFFDGLVS
ncbi:L,D-transpeptidase family protein [Roseateles sp. GG27B]